MRSFSVDSSAISKIDPQVTKDFGENEYVTYLIKMKEQADAAQVSSLAQEQALKNKVTSSTAKLFVRNAVIGSLRETAIKSQAPIESFLNKAKSANGGVKDYKSFFIVNALAVTSTKKVMEQLALRPEIEKILPNQEYFLDEVKKTEEPAANPSLSTEAAAPQAENVEWNIDYVQAPEAWDMGIDGTGIVVANLDTGVDYTHPALERKWRAYESGSIVNPELSWYDAHSGSELPEDNQGHGTHTMGTMVGSEEDGSNQIGVAPGAKWIAVRIFNPSTTDAIILDAGQWILAPVDSDGNLHPELAPDVVNNSWGGGAGMDEFFRPIVQAWRAAGIFPEFSAGNVTPTNPGGPGSVAVPANYPESFATGATDMDGNIADFSLQGPSPYGELKPEVSAPGVNIRSSVPGGGYEGGWEGTSMAGPVTTGIAALLLQANHSLTVDELEQILQDTAAPRTDGDYPESPNNAYGYGIVNAYEAVHSVVGDVGVGTVSGRVTTAGEDELDPVIEIEEPLSVVYTGREAKLSARVSDNISVVQVEAFIKSKDSDEYAEVPLTRVSGDFRSGQYESSLPAELMNPETELEYYVKATDFGENEAESPVYQVEVSGGIKPGDLQDFEGDTTGYMTGGTNNTWGIGTPKFGPKGAYSGSKVAASNLDTLYQSGANAYLLAPPIDLTDSPEGAVLSFKNWYKLTENFDHGVVYVATGSDEYELVSKLDFTGESDGWETQYVDLRPYAGERIDLIFNLYAANIGGNNEGWYIDDLSLQLPDSIPPTPPTGLTGESDSAGNVTLSWEAAADEDVAGYEVFRAIDDGSFEPVGTTGSTTYIDLSAVPDVNAHYQVVSFDYSGNSSEPSQAYTVEIPHFVPLFEDDFDGETDNGWTHSGQNDEWQRGAPSMVGPKSAISLPNVWGTNVSANYSDSSNYSLVSPVIDLGESEDASVYFYNWYDLEMNYDYGHFEITADGGTTWTELAVFNGSSADGAWELFRYDLGSYLNQQVQFRFRLESDSIINFAGWYIDNFRVLNVDTPDELMQANHVYDETRAPEPASVKPLLSIRGMNENEPGAFEPSDVAMPQSLPVNATVTILETGRSIRTNPATGQYSFRILPGTYHLKAEAYGYYPQEKSITVSDSATVTADFDLEAIPHGQITGVISDERTKEPIADANVMVLEDANIAPVRTDENGMFLLDVIEGTYTLSVSSSAYYGEHVTVTAPPNGSVEANVELKPFVGFPDSIGYDDGTAEDALAYYVGGNGFAVRMTPETVNAQVTGALFRFWDTTWPEPGATEFQYAIYDASGPGGTPGKQLAGPFQAEGLRDGNWTSVTFPSPVMVQGDFYIVYLQVGDLPYTLGMAVDLEEPISGRSWQFVNGSWNQFPDGDWMIRAQVNNQLNAPEITSPAPNSYTNDASLNVEGLSPAEGATVRLYNGAEEAGTAMVQDGKFTIPAVLRPGLNRLSAEAELNGTVTERSEPTDVVFDDAKPGLSVYSPSDNFRTNQGALTVIGSTYDEYFGTLTVNDEQVEVSSDGSFIHRSLLNEGDNVILVTSTDLAGNETTVTRSVYLDVNAPNIANLTPESDLNLSPGDTLQVSFDSEPGLNASFRIEYPIAPNGAAANEVTMTESPSASGHYEGSYHLPDSTIDGGIIVVRVRDESGNDTEAVASGRLFVNHDKILWENVNQAKDDFKAAVSNTKKLNEAVLALPVTGGILYTVTGSTHEEYVSKDGILIERPDEDTEVELTVTIAAAEKPAIKTDVQVKVTLPAPGRGGGGHGGGNGDGSGGTVPAPSAPSTNHALAAVINDGQTEQTVKPALKEEGTVITASVSDADLKQALNSAPVAVIVTIPAEASQQSQLRLTASQIALLSGSNAANSIVVTNGASAAALPVSVLDNAPAGADVQVTLKSAQSAAFSNAGPGTSVIGAPVAFEASSVQGSAVQPIRLSGKELVKQSFVLAEEVDVDAAGVLYLADGQVNPAPAVFASNGDGTTTVTIARPGYSTYAVATRAISFNDIGGAPAKDKIVALANKLLIEGTSNTAFSPKAPVTRAQFAAMLTRALGLPSVADLPFRDVASEDWYADEVGAAYQAGLITGLGNGAFHPDGTITHQDLAVMLERAFTLLGLKTDGVPGPMAYADANEISGYAADSVLAVTESGLMAGAETNGKLFFSPKASTTREEAAEAIFNLLQRAGVMN